MTPAQLDNWFSYHSLSPAQLDSYYAVRAAARALAEVINEQVPDSPDKTSAIRKLRECMMTANAAISCGGL